MNKLFQSVLFLLFVYNSSAQNMGVGTATPHSSAKLHIEDSNRGLLVPRISIPNLSAAAPVSSPATSLLVYNTNTSSGVGFYYWDGSQWNRLVDQSVNADNDWFEVGTTSAPNSINDNIFTQGNVGIGTTTPSTKLAVNGDNILTPWALLYGGGGIHENIALRLWDQGTDVNNINIVEFGHNSPSYVAGARIRSVNPSSNAATGANLFLETASDNAATWNSNQLMLRNNGNVGIGLASPAYKLHVYRNGPSHIAIEGNQTGYINAGLVLKANQSSNTRGLGTFMYDRGSQNEWFAGRPYAGSDRFVIQRQTGLSDHNDETAGVVNGSGGLTGTQRFFTVENNGRVGINTGTAVLTTTLEVNGTAGKTGGGTWTATSDRRTKKDINSFSDRLNILSQINPVTFKYNGLYNTVDDGQDYVGIIAQEVQKVAPYMIGSHQVAKDSESSDKEEILHYDGGTYLLYVLVNSVKEQQAVIEQQKTSNQQLQETIQALENRIQQLESK